MDAKYPTSTSIQAQKPHGRNQVNDKASNFPKRSGKITDLNDNQKRWLVAGICLHSVISPVLRTFVGDIFIDIYKYTRPKKGYLTNRTNALNQILSNYLQYNVRLNFDSVEGNKIKNAIDLSKLFLQPFMAQYTGFNETCDSSALLGLLSHVGTDDVRKSALQVKNQIRNPWAHCNFTVWTHEKYETAFRVMEQLIDTINILDIEENKQLKEELMQWNSNGSRFLSGDLDAVKEIKKQTQELTEYVKQARQTDEKFLMIYEKLETFEKKIQDKVDDLEKEIKRGFFQTNQRLTDLDKQLQLVNLCPCNASHNDEIKKWRKDEDVFEETHVVDLISTSLESNDCVLIIGEPGIGKSFLTHHLALKLQYKMKYVIIPCSSIHDIVRHYKRNEDKLSYMFVLDDICGRYTASTSDIEDLMKLENKIEAILKEKKTKIVATCRLDIYKDQYFQNSGSIFKSNVINLSELYLKEDKLKICAKYLTNKDIELLKKEDVPFTPLMCSLYSQNKNDTLADFLQSPYETYVKEWDILRSTATPHKYCALFLFVIYNGVIQESLFDISYGTEEQTEEEQKNKQKSVLKDVFETCGLESGTSRSKMKDVFESLIGTYLLKIGKQYKVQHDKMFDFMCCYFGNKKELVRCILHYADIRVINERTELQSITWINGEHDRFTVLITEDTEKEYFKRIKKDLKDGKMSQCFHNSQMKSEAYRSKLLRLLRELDVDFLIASSHKENSSKHEDNEDQFVGPNQFDDAIATFSCDEYKPRTGPFITSCIRGYYALVRFFISKGAGINTCYSAYTPLTAACSGGSEKIVEMLIRKQCDVDQTDGMLVTPLIAACSGNNEKIVKLLIKYKCDINHAGPLSAACSVGNEKIVQLLINRKAKVNQIDAMGNTPLTIACQSGNEKIVKILVDNRCDVNKSDCRDNFPLIYACIGGHQNIVELLLNKDVDVQKTDGMGRTSLHVACLGTNDDILRLLVNEGCKVNQTDISPIILASMHGNARMVGFLIEEGCHDNTTDGTGDTPLTTACKNGNEEIVHFLIQRNIDVNQANDQGTIPLMAACVGGNVRVVQMLIDKGCDVKQADSYGNTPLLVGCLNNREKVVELLLQNDVDVNYANTAGTTPLITACQFGNMYIVYMLIEKGCDVNKDNGRGTEYLTVGSCRRDEETNGTLYNPSYYDSFGQTPLTAACMHVNSTQIIKLLIDSGADVKQLIGSEQTPLTANCFRANEKMIELLIDKGSDVDQVDCKGWTPLTAACDRQEKKIVQLLINRGCKVNLADGMGQIPLVVACSGWDEEIVQLFIDKKCDVNLVSGNNKTPLTAACSNGNYEIAQLLVDEGSDVNQSDGMGNIPLTAACSNGNYEIAQLLVDEGSNVYESDGMGNTPLTAACSGGNEKIVQLLIDRDCDVNMTDSKGMSPLTAAFKIENFEIMQLLIVRGCDVKQSIGEEKTHLISACFNRSEKTVKLLIDRGCDVNQADGAGNIPLTAACIGGNEKIVQLLIDRNCDVNHADGLGNTPLTAACSGGNEKIVQLLIDRDCDVNQADGIGNTPLTAACSRGNEKIVQLLIDRDCDVNQADGIGNTPLTAACSRGFEKIVQFLIDKDCDVNETDSKGRTPLTAAHDGNYWHIVHFLEAIGRGENAKMEKRSPMYIF